MEKKFASLLQFTLTYSYSSVIQQKSTASNLEWVEIISCNGQRDARRAYKKQ